MDPGIYVLGVYATGVAVGGVIIAFISGTEDNTDQQTADDYGDTVSMRIGMCITWPLVLAVFTIYAPFHGIYKLGQWYGRRI